jgi:hypothetical protein
VVAGSIRMSPNPMNNQNPATLTATVTDAASGEANVTAAELSWGAAPAPPGSGFAMAGAFTSPTVGVSGTVPGSSVPAGERQFWVRGRDAGGNWGPASAATIVVNGDPTVGVGGEPALAFRLEQNTPNPFGRQTAIRFTLPRAAETRLEIFGLRGERVKTLIAGPRPAGPQSVTWNGRGESGTPAAAGVYFYRLTAGPNRVTRRMALLQ